MEKVEQLLNDEDWRAHCEARQPVTLEKNERREENKKRKDNVMNTRIHNVIYEHCSFYLAICLFIYLSCLFLSLFYVIMFLCIYVFIHFE